MTARMRGHDDLRWLEEHRQARARERGRRRWTEATLDIALGVGVALALVAGVILFLHWQA